LRWQEAFEKERAKRLSAEAEVERLRAQPVRADFEGRSGLLDAVERLNEALERKDAEVERLRVERDNCVSLAWHNEVVERLREELDLAETKVAEYEAGRHPNDQFLAQLDRANAAEAEVERQGKA
jgi:hypothetical protein